MPTPKRDASTIQPLLPVAAPLPATVQVPDVPLTSDPTSTPISVQPAATSSPPNTAETTATSIPSSTPVSAQGYFVARKQPVEQVLTAIGSAMGKPVLISARARAYKVTGDFALDKPIEALERVTSTLGMTWYFDGNAVYVYDGSESANVMLKATPAAMDALLAFLKQNALYDPRFPIRYTPQTRVLYLSAPPKYVEIVQSALSLMSNRDAASNTASNDTALDEELDRDTRFAVVVRVRHAFVADRTYTRRDTTLVTPGLATVLMRALGGDTQLVIADAPSTNTATPPLSGVPSIIGTPAAVAASALGAATETLNPLLPPLPLPPKTLPPPARPLNENRGASHKALRIIAHPAQNSLILEGNQRQIDQAKRLIAQLDIPKTQIELSLWVIDISKSDADRLGVQWNADVRFGSVEARYGMNLFNSATLSSLQTKQFIAAIAALTSLDKARIVSRPMLLAQDNSRAIYDNSTSFYVKLEGERFASLDRVTYGTMIDVLPRVVTENGRLEMEIAIEDGSVKTLDSELKLDMPVVASTHIDTVARVLHDQSLLVGGYTHDESTENISKIPLLGDIPYLGSLFRYRNVKLNQTVRLFLIQPRVLGDDIPFAPTQAETPQDIDNSVDALKNYLEQKYGRRKP